MQQRREEIRAKTARLAELKQQRTLRASQSTASRQSVGGANEVRHPPATARKAAELEQYADAPCVA